MRHRCLLWFSLIGGFLTGCQPEYYRAETHLNSDGTVERAISQPLSRVPAGSQQESAGWGKMFTTNGPQDAKNLDIPIHQLPDVLGTKPKPTEKKLQHPVNFVAWGQFPSVAAIPDHFEFSAEPFSEKKGKLVRKVDRVDYGFVTEFRWTETLLDTFDLAEHRVARDELASEAIKLGIAILNEAWGPDYDLRELERWLATDGVQVLHESLDLLVEIGARKALAEADENELRWKQLLKRHGLDLLDANGKLTKAPSFLNARLRQFVVLQLTKRVKDKQGQPLSEDRLNDLLKTFQLLPDSNQDVMNPTALMKATERVVPKLFGSEEQFQTKVNQLGIRLFGIYLWPILNPPRHFQYDLEMPGEIVSTTGELQSHQQVRWQFLAPNAFPFGYSMQATSLVPNAAALAKFAPQLKLDRRDQLLQYVALVKPNKPLTDALTQWTTQGNDELLIDWLKEHLNSNSLPVREHAEQVQTLLGR